MPWVAAPGSTSAARVAARTSSIVDGEESFDDHRAVALERLELCRGERRGKANEAGVGDAARASMFRNIWQHPPTMVAPSTQARQISV